MKGASWSLLTAYSKMWEEGDKLREEPLGKNKSFEKFAVYLDCKYAKVRRFTV